MGQATMLGEVETEAYLEVKRKSGAIEFFHVSGDVTRPITETEYRAALAAEGKE